MLSAETASGKFSVQSVEIMDRIIRGVENDDSYRCKFWKVKKLS